MRKYFCLSLVLILLFVTGCVGNSETGGTNTKSEGTDNGEMKAISIAMLTDAISVPIKQLIPQFEAETGIKVQWNEFDYDTLYERLYNDLRSESGTYDVIFADDPWFPMFAGGGFLTPLDEFGYEPDDDFAKVSRELGLWPAPRGPRLPGSDPNEKPRYYGVSQVGNVQMFFYRKDILDRAPETWTDVVEMIENHKDEIDYGFIHRGVMGDPIVTNFNAVMWSFGAKYFDDDWNVTLDSPEALAALELYLDLKKYAPEGVAAYNSDEIGRVMTQGNGLMAIVWPSWGEVMENPEKSNVVGKIGYSVVPKAKGKAHAPQSGNWLFAIPKGSKAKDPAFKFIEWMTSKEIQTEMTKLGGLPTRSSVLTDPELVAKYPYLEAVNDALQNAEWAPRTPLYPEIVSIFGTYLNQALTGDRSAKEALSLAADEIEELMEKNGY